MKVQLVSRDERSTRCTIRRSRKKWGLHVFLLADCNSGHLCAFEPYYGSATTNSLARPDLQFTARIVLHLCNEVKRKTNDRGYHLFTDR